MVLSVLVLRWVHKRERKYDFWVVSSCFVSRRLALSFFPLENENAWWWMVSVVHQTPGKENTTVERMAVR